MKVLITTEVYNSNINGVATSVKNLERGLTKLGHEVKIITVSDNETSYKHGNVYYIKSFEANEIYPDIRIAYGTLRKFKDEIIAWKPDIIHSQSEFFTFDFAKEIKGVTKARHIHTYHTMYDHYLGHIPFGRYIGVNTVAEWIRYRLRKCDVVIAPTTKIADSLKSFGLKNNIEILPTGIDLEKYKITISPSELQKTREEYGIIKHQKVILTLCRLSYEKNIAELLKGLKSLLMENETTVFMIVGDGPAKEDLEMLTKELGMQKQVIFTGMITPERVPYFYQMADVFMSASVTETQGLTYIEALASGLPLVCKNDPCLDGLIEVGSNGFIYDAPEDLPKLTRNVFDELNKGYTTSQISCAIANKYGIKEFAKGATQIYNS